MDKISNYTPFKMRGSPFKRNFGVGSPLRDHKKDADGNIITHKKKTEPPVYVQPPEEKEMGLTVEESKSYAKFGGYKAYVKDI